MTCQRSKSRLKKKGKITKYDDPSTKVVYNSTTKYDFVSICLQFLLKSAKINQRVKQRKSFCIDSLTMDRWQGNRHEMMARYTKDDPDKEDDDNDTTKQQQHKKQEKKKTTKQKQPDGDPAGGTENGPGK